MSMNKAKRHLATRVDSILIGIKRTGTFALTFAGCWRVGTKMLQGSQALSGKNSAAAVYCYCMIHLPFAAGNRQVTTNRTRATAKVTSSRYNVLAIGDHGSKYAACVCVYAW